MKGARKRGDKHADGLKARAHSDRSAALERVRADEARARDAEVRRLQAKIVKTHAAHDANVSKAEKVVDTEYQLLASAFVCAWHEKIRPLVRDWYEDPTRRTSNAIGEACASFDDRANSELRAPTGASPNTMSLILLVCAFAEPLLVSQPNAINAFAAQDSGVGPRFLDVLVAVIRAARLGGPELYERLEDVERSLRAAAARVAAGADVRPDARRRFAVRQSAATAHDLSVALAALDREIQAERAAHIARTYKAPGARIF